MNSKERRRNSWYQKEEEEEEERGGREGEIKTRLLDIWTDFVATLGRWKRVCFVVAVCLFWCQ